MLDIDAVGRPQIRSMKKEKKFVLFFPFKYIYLHAVTFSTLGRDGIFLSIIPSVAIDFFPLTTVQVDRVSILAGFEPAGF